MHCLQTVCAMVIWHYIGKYNRKIIPSYVVVAIRNEFQSDVYRGFQMSTLPVD